MMHQEREVPDHVSPHPLSVPILPPPSFSLRDFSSNSGGFFLELIKIFRVWTAHGSSPDCFQIFLISLTTVSTSFLQATALLLFPAPFSPCERRIRGPLISDPLPTQRTP